MAVRTQGTFRSDRITKYAGRALAGLALACLGAACGQTGTLTSGVSAPRITFTGPSTWTITGPQGGPFTNRTMDVLLENHGIDPIDWSANSIPSFVLLDLASGTIAANSQTTVHASLDSVLAATLPVGNSSGMLAFHNDTAPQTDIGITTSLSVSAPGVSILLVPAPDFATTGPAGGPFVPPSTVYSITNTGSAALSWRASAGDAWVTASPVSGQLAPNASVDVTVAINNASTSGLSQGVHWSYVDFVDAASNTNLDRRNIGLTVTQGAPQVGWTVFTPSSDTRTVYVSSSQGNDTNDGLSSSTPKRTIAAGKALLRTGRPDWLLLKCGDTWDGSLGQWEGLSGRSITERMLVASYGTGERPLLRTGNQWGAQLLNHNNPANFIAFVGIHFWANTYNGSNGSPDCISWLQQSQGLLVEDCKIEAYYHAFVIQGGPDTSWQHVNVQIRRNVIADSYSTNGSWSGGIFAQYCAGLLLEENLFDRNGWNESVPGSTPSWYLHNVYVHNDNTGVVFRGNLVAGCDGVQIRSGGTVEDNVFLRTGIALEFGLGTFPNVAGVSGVVRNNVVLDGNDLGTNGPSQGPRGWGFQIGNLTSSTIENNIICNNVNGHSPRAISVEYANGWSGNTRGVEHTTVQNNIIYNWGGPLEFRGASNQLVDFHLQGNVVQELLAPSRLINHTDSTNTVGVHSNDNVFYSAPLALNSWMQVGGTPMSVAAWKPLAQDTTSVTQQVSWPDPDRTIGSYHASIGGTPTYEAFLAQARLQSKANWRPQYTAEAVKAYIRAGFGL